MTRLSEAGERNRVGGAVWIAAAVLLLLLHLFRNGSQIADRELGLDEAWTYYVASRPLLTNLTLPITYHAQPPLYYLILHALLRVNGAEWFLRGFSWLAILGLLGFVLRFLTELNPLARVFLCAVLVTHEITRYLAQELRPYALSTLSSFVATILFVRLLGRPGRRAALAYGAAALVSLYTFAFDVWVFAAHVLWLAVTAAWQSRGGWRGALRRHSAAALSVTGVALLYLPYLVLAWHWHGATGAPEFSGSLQKIVHPGYSQALRYFLGFGLSPVAAWMTIACVLGGIFAELRRGNATVLLVAAIILGQVVFVQAFLYGRSSVANRYYTPVFPLFWFLVSVGFHHLIPRPPKLVWVVVLPALALGAGTLAFPFFANAARPVPRSEWRQVRDALAAVPGRKVVLFDYGFEAQMLEYEARDDRDMVIKSKRQPLWQGFPQHLQAESLEPEDVERTIEGESAADCFFYFIGRYFVDRGPSSPYFSVFVPAMNRRGYEAIPFFGSGHGFCRP